MVTLGNPFPWPLAAAQGKWGEHSMQIVSVSWSDRLSWGAQAWGWGDVSEPSVPGGLVPSRASSPDTPQTAPPQLEFIST